MKKILFSLIMLLSCVTMVNAKDVFKPVWQTEDYKIDRNEIVYDYNSHGLSFKDGYIVTNIEKYEDTYVSHIKYYDKAGKLIDKYTIEEFVFIDVIVHEDNIYALVEDFGEFGLIKIDSNFELIGALYLSDDEQEDFDTQESIYVEKMLNFNILGLDFMDINNDKIAFLTLNENVLVSDLDLTEYQTLPMSEETAQKYLPEMYTLTEFIQDDGEYMNAARNEKNTVLTGDYPVECQENAECEKEYIGSIRLFDSNGNVVFTKEYPEYQYFLNVLLIDEYIVTLGATGNEESSINEIVILDLKGNIIQTFTSENYYVYLNEVERGFIVTNYNVTETTVTTHSELYQLPWKITPKITGKGTIEVVDNELPGTDVTFKVTPQEGYVLSEVKVTDANGKVVTFKDYQFTMPSADVTIEVTFVENKNNPETTDVAVIACIAIIVLGGIGTIYSIRKLSWLK